jgi:hypothetical protein
MKFVTPQINVIKSACRANSFDIEIDCDMPEGYCEDLLCEICDWIGEEAFVKIVKKYELDQSPNALKYMLELSTTVTKQATEIHTLRTRHAALVAAAQEVIRISDRKHDAWDKLKSEMKEPQ